MKTIYRILAVTILLALTMSPASAAEPIKVTINGTLLKFDVPPTIVSGRTLVPLRNIFEALAADVAWDEKNQTVTGKKGNTTIVLKIGSKSAAKNGIKLTLDAAPTIIKGRTLVPARFIAESLGALVNWDSKTSTVIISEKVLTTTEIGKKSNTVVYIENTQVGGTVTQGSGFLIASDGQIVTNYHVIDKAAKLEITLDNGTKYSEVKVLGYDPDKDIAVLKITAKDLTSAVLGNSDMVLLGNDVVAIGSPIGLKNTLSTGVVSGLREGLIQTTAPISPGSSGGALFNIYGEVIGITSSGYVSGENLGFAIPIKELKTLDLPGNLTLEAIYNLEYPERKPNMNYEQFSDYLWNTGSIFSINDKTYEIEFNDIIVDENQDYPGMLLLAYSLNTENLEILRKAYQEGFKESVTDLLLDSVDDLKDYYPGKSIVAFIMYADDKLKAAPSGYEKNPLSTVQTVKYNDSTGFWEVIYPLLTITYDESEASYRHIWTLP